MEKTFKQSATESLNEIQKIITSADPNDEVVGTIAMSLSTLLGAIYAGSEKELADYLASFSRSELNKIEKIKNGVFN